MCCSPRALFVNVVEVHSKKKRILGSVGDDQLQLDSSMAPSTASPRAEVSSKGTGYSPKCTCQQRQAAGSQLSQQHLLTVPWLLLRTAAMLHPTAVTALTFSQARAQSIVISAHIRLLLPQAKIWLAASCTAKLSQSKLQRNYLFTESLGQCKTHRCCMSLLISLL